MYNHLFDKSTRYKQSPSILYRVKYNRHWSNTDNAVSPTENSTNMANVFAYLACILTIFLHNHHNITEISLKVA